MVESNILQRVFMYIRAEIYQIIKIVGNVLYEFAMVIEEICPTVRGGHVGEDCALVRYLSS